MATMTTNRVSGNGRAHGAEVLVSKPAGLVARVLAYRGLKSLVLLAAVGMMCGFVDFLAGGWFTGTGYTVGVATSLVAAALLD